MPLSEKAARSKDRSFPIPNMQHRHFAFIAGCIRDIPTPSARVEAARVFATELKRTNDAFDPIRFSDACDCEADQYTLEELDCAITHARFWLDYLVDERVTERGITEPATEAV